MRILLDTSPLSQLAHPHARRTGRPTAHPHALDIDIIIAAQAEMLAASVATENTRHLALFVNAGSWREMV